MRINKRFYIYRLSVISLLRLSQIASCRKHKLYNTVKIGTVFGGYVFGGARTEYKIARAGILQKNQSRINLSRFWRKTRSLNKT